MERRRGSVLQQAYLRPHANTHQQKFSMVPKKEKFTGNSGRARDERRRHARREKKEKEEKINSGQLTANRKAHSLKKERETKNTDRWRSAAADPAGQGSEVTAGLPCVVFLSFSSFVWLLGRILISGGSGLWLVRDALRAFRYCRRVTWNRIRIRIRITESLISWSLSDFGVKTCPNLKEKPHPYELQVGQSSDGVVRTVAGRAGGLGRLKRIPGRVPLGRDRRLVH